jgi:hypothetical protein
MDEITSWHLSRGFSDNGYHYGIMLDGSVVKGRPIYKIGAHCKGHNRNTAAICYIGGLSEDGRVAKDTRTPEQIKSLESLVNSLKTVFNISKVSGHNEYSSKKCPCFNVKKEYN